MFEVWKKPTHLLYISSFIVSICGIIYQMLLGAAGSYLMGSSILSYAIAVGGSLSGMGVGAIISERMKKHLIERIIGIEYIIGPIGASSTLIIYMMFSVVGSNTASVFFCLLIFVLGCLTGMELPILIREAEKRGDELKKSAARTLFSDYAGSLIGTLGFALLLSPWLGYIQTAFFVGLINVTIAFWLSLAFRKEIQKPRSSQIIGIILLIILGSGFLFGNSYAALLEQRMYDNPVVINEDTPYQRIVGTIAPGDFRFYLNGNLQFAESDEYRYHESLVHPGMGLLQHQQKDENNMENEGEETGIDVLIMGGGDGLAIREMIPYDNIDSMKLVDLDPKVTELAKSNPHLTDVNEHSLEDERVSITHGDAFSFIKESEKTYDLILSDLPDPNSLELSKLYSRELYGLMYDRLDENGVAVIQSTSPVFARKSYWTISETIKGAGFYVDNFHVDIPSFGNWGFTIATKKPFNVSDINIPKQANTKYLHTDMVSSLFQFGKDETKAIDGFSYQENTINHPVLADLYNKAWRFY
ncbi:polyamine aminopropyltransferase [Salibacterium salarium]|uniref:Polyamine aminopropyltransferase n=1 Tax=Salibacterium salarium TaxID=284579 RepID=A0A428N5E5_9BACI|nr:polyamine aminopropyltransferase [Salibacterium salarium]RSL33710.1 polyamine aminopropyltransferase [Salibacterium salarium]